MLPLLASLRTRYRTRLVAGLLAVTLPVTVLLVVLLALQAAGQLEEQTQARLERRAAAIASDVEAWLAERFNENGPDVSAGTIQTVVKSYLQAKASSLATLSRS